MTGSKLRQKKFRPKNKMFYDGTEYSMRNHPLYNTWHGMNDRVYRENYPHHNNYKGIIVCDRWRAWCFGGEEENPFKNFCDDMGIRPDNATLDRIDCFGNYEPENCRWLSRIGQCHNKRKKTKLISTCYLYHKNKNGTVWRQKRERISLLWKGKRYTQLVRKDESPKETMKRLKKRVSPELDDYPYSV